jgi:hypothetical protein
MGLMNLREKLIGSKKAGVAVVAVILVVCGFVVWTTNRGPVGEEAPKHKMFFVDEETGEEAVQLAADLPPVMGKNGKETLVQGVYMSGDGGQTRQLVFLMKYSPEAKAVMKKIYANTRYLPSDSERQIMEQGTFYRLPDKNSPWVSGGDAEAIRARSVKVNQGQTLLVVRP